MKKAVWLLGLSFAGAFALSTHVAGAEPEPREPGRPGEVNPHGITKDEPKLQLGLDMVFGVGRSAFAAQSLPTPLARDFSYYREDASTKVASFLISGSYGITSNIRAGVRVPFQWANFSPADSRSRAALPFGNIELSIGYGKRDEMGGGYVGALGLTLPTAQGDELPPASVLGTLTGPDVDQNAFDRWSANRAASKARGYEVDELYQTKRIGLVPRFSYRMVSGKLTLEPQIKVANLIGTTSSLEHAYLGMAVASMRAGYRVHPMFEVNLRAWANVAFAGSTDDDKVSLSVEPQVVAHLGDEVEHVERFRPTLGVVVPIIGPAADPRFIGVRLGLSVGF